jgi:hypothetical protein
MVTYYYYCSVSLVNAASVYVTLNSSSNADYTLFLSDSSYSLAPGANQPIVQKASQNGWATYNITQNALLKLTWTLQTNGHFSCTAVVVGSTAYTATGYNDPVDTNDGLSYYTAFTITLSPTS